MYASHPNSPPRMSMRLHTVKALVYVTAVIVFYLVMYRAIFGSNAVTVQGSPSMDIWAHI